MEVYSIKLINDENKSEGKEAQHYAYEITCVRSINDVLYVSAPLYIASYGMMFEGYISKISELSYTKNWEYERMNLKIDNKGIFEFTWLSPLEILDTEVEDSKLLSFD